MPPRRPRFQISRGRSGSSAVLPLLEGSVRAMGEAPAGVPTTMWMGSAES